MDFELESFYLEEYNQTIRWILDSKLAMDRWNNFQKHMIFLKSPQHMNALWYRIK